MYEFNNINKIENDKNNTLIEKGLKNENAGIYYYNQKGFIKNDNNQEIINIYELCSSIENKKLKYNNTLIDASGLLKDIPQDEFLRNLNEKFK